MRENRILLAHPGFSMPRHFNNYEAFVKLVMHCFGAECEAIVCGKMIKACGFRGGDENSLPETSANEMKREQCHHCQKKLIRRLKYFCNEILYLSHFLNSWNIDIIEKEAHKFIGILAVKDILNIRYNGINIGKDIWQSIQRYLYMGTPKEIEIVEGSIAYEYIVSGLKYAYAIDNLLRERSYTLVLLNEASYIDWGIPARLALNHKIKVVRQGSYFNGLQMIVHKLYRELDDLPDNPHIPPRSEVKHVFDDYHLKKSYASSGEKKLLDWMTKNNNKSVKDTYTKTKSLFFSNRKNIIIFTHLCWDASMAYGDMIFETFEEWMEKTYEISVNMDEYDWFFKIHPSENQLSNQHFNTFKFLTGLTRKSGCEHIKIIGHKKDISTFELMPFINLAVTSVGTVAFEGPSHGVPCFIAAKRDYSTYGFAHTANSINEYEQFFQQFKKLQPLTQQNQQDALAFCGILFDENRYLDVRTLMKFPDSSDKHLNSSILKRWVNKEKNKDYAYKNFKNLFNNSS